MVVSGPELMFFSFIEPEHPFYPQIQRFYAMLVANPLYSEMTQKINTGGKTTIHAEIKGRLVPEHGWELNRLSWSFQDWVQSGPLRFDALTLLYSAETGRVEYHRFPQDPYLTTAASFFDRQPSWQNSRGTAGQIDVLRYVPLRRLTFRAADWHETNAPVIGKFKRKSRLKDAYDTLVWVSRAINRSPSSFSVAAPVRIDEEHCLFFQEEKRGKDLSSLLDEKNFKGLLHSVGAIHHDLHRLNIAELPEWDFGAFLQNVEKHIQWISFFRPDQEPFLNNVGNLLRKRIPCVGSGEYTFCHGNFVCWHILKDKDCWSVIDYESGMRGDPYRGIAMLMASLPYTVPFFERDCVDSKKGKTGQLEEAYGAYLDGYQEKAKKALDRKRLLWYRICSEIHYLARMFRRDRFCQIAFDRNIQRLRDLCEQLQKETGRGL